MVGRPVRSFSYPHGTQKDVDERVRSAVAASGYANAVTSIPVTQRRPDPFLVSRFSVGPSFGGFRATLAGVDALR